MLDWLKKLFTKSEVVQEPAALAPEPLPEAPPEERELPDDNFGGKVKLGIIVGHSKNAQGARMCEPHGLYEYSYNMEVAKVIKDSAPSNVTVEIILRDGSRGEIPRAYKEARDKLCDCVIELHFDAFNGQVRGTSTLSTPDLSDVDFSHIVHRSMITLFERKDKEDRGVRTISKSVRGGINVHSFPGGVNCLVEPFFGDNKLDADMGMVKRVLYAKCLLEAVILWAKKVDLIKQ